MDVGNLISASSAFSKSSLNIWEFMVHLLLKTGLENFEHYFASVWDECDCVIVWAFFGIAFLLDWNENWPFPVLWPLLSFPDLLAYWVQHFDSIRTQEKGAVTQQETDLWVSVSAQESPVEAWVCGGLLQGQGHWVQQCVCVGLFEGGCHYLHYLHHSLISGQATGGNTALPINRKLD